MADISDVSSREAHVRQRLREILVEQVGYDAVGSDLFHDETSLFGRGLGLDSMDVMALVMRVENEFEIFFEDADLALSTETLGALTREVLRRVETRREDTAP